MTKRRIKNTILLILPIIYIILYKTFIYKNYMTYAEMITTSFLTILLTLSIVLLGFRKFKKNYISTNIFRIVLFYIIITFVLMYGMGLYVGFLKNSYSTDLVSILNNILAPILIILITEMFRYVFIWANKDKRHLLRIFTIVLMLLELIISIRSLPLDNAEEMFRLSATVIIPIIVKNAVLSYLCYQAGFKIPMFYRLIMDVYGFLVPIVPDFGEYIQSLILISLPIVIYIHSFTIIDERERKVEHIFVKQKLGFLDIPIIVCVAVLTGLISGLFPLYMIGIGSDSMSPKINKGDVVVLMKISEKTKLKTGSIIAFEHGGKIIVHRIKEITKKNGNTVYVTKGDANNTVDSDVVKRKDIKGMVKLKFPVIGWPTVILSEYMHG